MLNEIKEAIKKARPNLSESSIKTYTSLLSSLYKKLFDKKDFDIKDFKETNKIISYLEEMPPNKTKTTLSALVVLNGDDKYRKLMLEKINVYTKEIDKQEKTEEQKQNWMTKDEINAIYDKLKKNAMILYKKPELNKNDYQEIQNFIILSVYHLIPPRRLQDYTFFKINTIDKKTDNYYDKGTFYFNKFKTAKFHENGQTIKLPTFLKQIIEKWINTIQEKSDFLFFDKNFNKLSTVNMNQRINSIFGKSKAHSVNLLRHIYLTDKYRDVNLEMKKMDKDMEDMGSSSKQMKTYIKLD